MRTQYSYICAQCSTPFTTHDIRARFCSQPCQGAHTGGPLDLRFWRKVERTPTCWLWRGTLVHGYGKLTNRGAQLRAHRVAWELVAGPIPAGLDVLHICDVHACVRNDDEGVYEVNGVLLPRRGHLVLGTHEANMADMVAKGRQVQGATSAAHRYPERRPRGETHGRAKLTLTEVEELRRAYIPGTVTLAQVAARFGVSESQVSRIVNGKKWQHVPVS